MYCRAFSTVSMYSLCVKLPWRMASGFAGEDTGVIGVSVSETDAPVSLFLSSLMRLVARVILSVSLNSGKPEEMS